MAILSATALGVAVQRRALLEGIDLQLAPGERVAIVGASGSGKTTLLRTLAGLVDASAGTLMLGGKTASDLGWPAWRRRVVYANQRPVMFPGTVRDNLVRPFSYLVSRTIKEPSNRALEAALDKVGIRRRVLEQEARTLSEGQRQRVGLVRAVLVSPDVLLLDEPTSALDEAAVAAVESFVLESGCAVAAITHDLRQAERLCDRVLDIGRYRVVAA